MADMRLMQTQQLQPEMRLELDRMGKFYELLDYWDNHSKMKIQFNVGDQEHSMDCVLAPPSFLEYVSPSEKFGAYVGEMMFINSSLAQNHPDWIPYIALKLYAEKFVPNASMDVEGTVKHHDTLYRIIRLAAGTMETAQAREFISTLQKHESSGYFEMDQQAQEFLERSGGDPKRGKREYLEKHHHNRWVTQGRVEEELDQLGLAAPGFRNHAEAVYRAIVGSDMKDLYLASIFTSQLVTYDPNTPVIVTPPFNALAYAMTIEGNGIVDLVQFLPTSRPNREDAIVRIPGAMRTWTALRKRLSFGIHRTEENVRQLSEKTQGTLDSVIIEAQRNNDLLVQEMGNIRALVQQSGRLHEAKEKLSRASGRYAEQLRSIESASSEIAGRLADLDELSQMLAAQI